MKAKSHFRQEKMKKQVLLFILILSAAYESAVCEDPFSRNPDSADTLDSLISPLFSRAGYEGVELINGVLYPIRPEWESGIDQQKLEQDLLDLLDLHLQRNLQDTDLRTLIEEIDRQDRSRLYQSENGTVLFDESGDPLLRSSDPEEIRRDRAAWESGIRTVRDSVLRDWDLSADTLLSDILHRLSPDLRDSVEEQMTVKLKGYRTMVRRETDRLITWSAEKFDYSRNEDIYSLRKKSEDETAAALTDSLIRNTRMLLDETDRALEQGLSDLKDAAVEEASFSLESWDESFRKEFGRGLDKWDRAEKALMAERIDWELRAETGYLEAEKAWDEAFDHFARSRTEWIRKLSGILEEGRVMWISKEESFNTRFRKIALELEEAALEQERKFASQVESALAVYRESAALVVSAEENILFYRKKLEEEQPPLDALNRKITELEEEIAAIGDGWFSSINRGFLQNRLKAATESRDRRQATADSLNGELTNWVTLKASFRHQMAAAESMLRSLENTAVGYDSSVPAGSLENEITRMDDLAGRLYIQWQISEAVVDYADQNSSLRPTEAQTREDLKEAGGSLAEEERIYGEAIEDLEAIRIRLSEKQSALKASRTALEAARQEMLDAKETYETSLAIYHNNNPAVIELMIGTLETEIKAWFNGLDGHPSGRNELYDRYIAAAERERRETADEERLSILRDLTGTEQPGEFDTRMSLTDLEERITALNALSPDLGSSDPADWQNQLLTAGISRDTQEYEVLTGLYTESFSETNASISRLMLQNELRKMILEYETEGQWNRNARKWLQKESRKNGETAAAVTTGLTEAAEKAETAYYLEKSELLLEILPLAGGTEEPDEPWAEYLEFLRECSLSFTEEDSRALSGLANRLRMLHRGRLDRQELTKQAGERELFWLGIITGDNPAGLPASGLLDLYLSGALANLNTARKDLDAWRDLSRHCPAFSDEILSRTCLLEAVTGDGFLEKAGGITTLEELTEYYRRFNGTGMMPSHLTDLTNRYFSLKFSEELKALKPDPESREADLDELSELLAVIEQDPLSDEALAGYEEHGLADEVRQLILYRTLRGWRTFSEKARKEGTDEEQLWQDFLAVADTRGLPVTREDLKEVDFQARNYTRRDNYLSWIDGSIDDFMDTAYPDLGFLEREYLRTLILTGSDRSAADSEGLLFRSAAVLYSRLEEVCADLEASCSDARLLARLAGIEPEQENPAAEYSFVTGLLTRAVDALFDDLPAEGPAPSAELYQQILSRAAVMRGNRKNLAKLESDLKVSRQSGETYKTEVVDRDFAAFTGKNETFQSARTAWEIVLSEFDELQSEFLTAQQGLDAAAAAYRTASADYQQAEEIHDYARCAYSPRSLDIRAIREGRKAEYEKTAGALNILREIRDSGKTESEIDKTWKGYVSKKMDTLSLKNTLTYTREELNKQLGDMNREYGRTRETLSERIGDCFRMTYSYTGPDDETQTVNMGFSYSEETMDEPMTDFTAWNNSELERLTEAYFKEENASAVFSRDTLLWLDSLTSAAEQEASGQGRTGDRKFIDECISDLLKQFSYAFYHELDRITTPEKRNEEYRIDLFQIPTHVSLLDQSGNIWKSVKIGYEGDLEKYRNGEYQDIWKVIRNSNNDIYKVFIGPEEWLKENTESEYNTVSSSPALNKLYSFYKVMMSADMFVSPLASAMEKDLSDLAWKYLDEAAYSQQKKFKRKIRGGFRGLGKKIQSKRETIQSSAAGFKGDPQRNHAVRYFGSAVTACEKLRESSEQMESLTGSVGTTIAGVTNTIKELTGITLNRSLSSLLESAFAGLTESGRRSIPIALNGMIPELEKIGAVIDQNASLRETELAQERSDVYKSLLRAYAEGDLDKEKYRQAALLLYSSPACLNGDYLAYRRSAIQEAADYSDSTHGNILAAYGRNLITTFRSRLKVVKQDRYNDLQTGLEEIYRRRDYWETRTGELTEAGMEEWNRSTERLIGQRERWRQGFSREYEYKEQLWEARYLKLIANRNRWLEDSAGNAVSSGAESMAADMGLEADCLIGEVSFSLIPDITVEAGCLSDMVSDALDGRNMYKMMAGIQSMTARAGGHDFILSAVIPSVPDTTSRMDDLTEKQKELKENLKKSLALAQALKMTEMLDETAKMAADSLEDANRNVENSVDSQLSDGGYVRSGTRYSRTILIDSSLLGGDETERQEVGAYRYYKAPGFKHGIDLSPGKLKQLNSAIVQARVQKTQQNMQNYLKLIFGNETDENGNPVDIRTGLDSSFLKHLTRQEEAFRNSAQYDRGYEDDDGVFHDSGYQTDTKGLFNFHVGYGPEMDDEDPEKVEQEGYGEMGRIYRDFMIQQARLYRGLSTVDAPWYSQKLWDDDTDNDGDSDGFLGAPSMRSITDLVMTVAGSLLTGGVGGFLFNLIDDVIFTMADVGRGIMNKGQAALGFVKKAGTALLNTATGGLFDKLDVSQLMDFGNGIGGRLLDTAADIGTTGLQTAVNTYGGAALNSVNLENGFDMNTFNSMTSWNNMGASLLGNMADTALDSTFGLALTDDYIKQLGNSGWGRMAGRVGSIGSFAGSAARGLTEYAMTGQTTLNILNFSMLGLNINDKTLQGGLLELTLGNNGISSRFGSGGIRADYGRLASVTEGLYVLGAEHSIQKNTESFTKRVNELSGTRVTADEMARLNRMQRAYGGLAAKEQAADMMRGNTALFLSTGGDGKARTELENSIRTVTLNNRADFSDVNSLFDSVVTLNHEAFRDGITEGRLAQILETRRAVRGHVDTIDRLMADYGPGVLMENPELMEDYLLYKEYGNKYVDGAYDSSADFWKIKNFADGTYQVIAEYDENGNLIKDVTFESYDKNGNLKSAYTPSGQEFQNSLGQAASLGNAIGLENAARILGSDLSDADLYDTQTLKDVLKLSDSEIKNIQRSGSLDGLYLTHEQNLALAGEALLKKEDFSWDENSGKWKTDISGNSSYDILGYEGLEVVGNSWRLGTSDILTGDILGKVNKNGGYDYSTISAHVLRDTDSYKSSIGDTSYQGLDKIYFLQRNLNGEVFNSAGYDGFQTVDIMRNGNVNQPYDHPLYGNIQGNTIAPGSFWMQMGGDSDYPSEAWIIHDALTIDGTTIGSDGNASGDYLYNRIGRWLAHQNRNNDQQDSFGTDFDDLFVDGCIGTSTTNWNKIIDDIYGWGAFSGYDIKTKLYEYNYNF